ncbi:iron-sulfur cluster biosynthesis family protein [Liquorilactobacillus satsumensis]|uniref:Core domain-containing protein n=1 Tax=Liquorilactobacillus satsumensis DSM 16230 = JCM 12392 TaxID=1423801 RepID=A0A0R1UXK6_9LACO|nr:iron-sulfur cluster biosynthesis family protein [Liquorilactobacillus satsumensis]KRL98000.1 hypothetical protein FD50_GL000958 [Liquorilactobacillus satsumensis DSM 16230 = JCM 12392]MCC7667508.1 iron-sulfur cluster biosynthesis family protein [Liquorilactobacillus satsumensis]MCP9312335.1 iron-sulfur cluster biosynthesis family protein [Liquorilactobacillus satsumensis]MCP9327690.1 iron-sulfur cluster biosynthesis family protein [Liquorilactobacillus satsumensis]MCP9357039.1 iron-sulfur c
MYLKITAAAQAKLKDKIGNGNYKILLDFDDGVGSLSRVGACTLASVFRILLVDPERETHDYNQKIDSDLGPIMIKGYSDMYMDDEMKLDVNEKTQMLRLSGSNSGELTAAVNVEKVGIEV